MEVIQHSAHCSAPTEVPRSLALPGTVPFSFTLSLVLLALTPIHYGAKGPQLVLWLSSLLPTVAPNGH